MSKDNIFTFPNPGQITDSSGNPIQSENKSMTVKTEDLGDGFVEITEPDEKAPWVPDDELDGMIYESIKEVLYPRWAKMGCDKGSVNVKNILSKPELQKMRKRLMKSHIIKEAEAIVGQILVTFRNPTIEYEEEE